MRILVFGAGVLGCNLANNLFRDGKDVTLLARGNWAKNLEENGLKIHHYFGNNTTSRIPVIEELKTDDRYDVIFIVVRCTQLDSVIPVLKNNISENIVFVGNNVRAADYRRMLSDKNVMFAFGSSAGHRESDHLESVDIRRITIGQLKEDRSNEEIIKKIFNHTKYRVTYETNMGDWLLCHAASVLPIAFMCYYTQGDIRKVRKNKIYLNRVMDASISAYRVLEENGHEILPDSDKGYKSPGFKKKYLPFYQLICSTKLGRLCTSDHAMNAVDEMNALNDDFRAVLLRYGEIPKEWSDLEKDCSRYIVTKQNYLSE